MRFHSRGITISQYTLGFIFSRHLRCAKKMLLRKDKKNVICVVFCTLLGDSAHFYSSNVAINMPVDQNGQRAFTYFSTNLITYFIQKLLIK